MLIIIVWHINQLLLGGLLQRSEGGLFVDMYSFLAFGMEYVMWNYEKTGNPVYLNIKETPKQVSEDRPHKKPTLLAIGMHPQLSCLPFLGVMVVRTMTHQMPLHVLNGYTYLTS